VRTKGRLGRGLGRATVDRGGGDEDIITLDTTTNCIEVHGPITRSREQQLCCQVNSFLCLSANDLENRLLPNDLIVIRK
jgi:hypothetical protein